MTTTTKTRGHKSCTIHGFKALPLEGPGVYEAFVAIFGNVDHVKDRIIFGAFEKSLDRWIDSGDPVPVIFSHRWDDIDAHIGVTLDAKEVPPGDPRLPPELLELGGLWTKNRLDVEDPDAASARRVWTLLERRSLKEFSFAYDVLDSKRQADGVLDLLELDLIEQGPTLKGANPMTQLLSRKADAAKASVYLSGCLEEMQDAAWDAAAEWAETTNTGNGGFYCLYIEGTFSDRIVVLVEGWDDPCRAGTYYELDLAYDEGVATVSNPREVAISGVVGTVPVEGAPEETYSSEGPDYLSRAAARKRRLADRMAKSTTTEEPPPTVTDNGDDVDNPEPGDGNGEDQSGTGTGEAARALLEIDLAEVELAT